MSKVVAFLLVFVVSGCGVQIVPDRLRADRIPGLPLGEWSAQPEVLIHPAVTENMEALVREQLSTLGEQVGCTYAARRMDSNEVRLHTVFGVLFGKVVVTDFPPLIPAEATTETHSLGKSLAFAEIRLGIVASRRTVRHELAHAVGGLGNIEGGDPALLMTVGEGTHGYAEDTESLGEFPNPGYGYGYELTEWEMSHFPCDESIGGTLSGRG